MVGKIYKKLSNKHGYIIDESGNIYLFSNLDILDDTEIIEGTLVKFKPKKNLILKATYITKV
jgi:hypothetical protein